MADPVTIAYLGVPQGKGRPRFVRDTGRTYTPEKTRKYEDALREAAEEAMGDRKPFDGPVELTMLAQSAPPASWSKKKREAALRGEIMPTGKPDSDNVLKAAGDAFNGVVFLDDAQIVTATVRKRYGAQALVVVTVREAIA